MEGSEDRKKEEEEGEKIMRKEGRGEESNEERRKRRSNRSRKKRRRRFTRLLQNEYTPEGYLAKDTRVLQRKEEAASHILHPVRPRVCLRRDSPWREMQIRKRDTGADWIGALTGVCVSVCEGVCLAGVKTE